MGGLVGLHASPGRRGLAAGAVRRVWNDVRTVLLLVVLMFLATSVTFDELLVMHPSAAGGTSSAASCFRWL